MRNFVKQPRTIFASLVSKYALLGFYIAVATASTGFAETEIQYNQAEKLCDLDFVAVKESSGLAVSRIQPDLFWTHNDSGDKPRLYAFDGKGKALGTYDVMNVRARDWEDMASFELDERPYLLVGDVGDNGKKRTEYQLFLIPESVSTAQPTLTNDSKNLGQVQHERGQHERGQHELTVERIIRYRYESGPQDCESIAFDSASRKLLFVTKNWSLTAEVYILDWHEVAKEPLNSTKVHIAKRIGKINVPGATAMDISPDGHRAVVLCYGNAYEYVRSANETWETAFARRSREIKMPERKQGETICYGTDGATLFLTSEHQPTPLFRVAPRVKID